MQLLVFERSHKRENVENLKKKDYLVVRVRMNDAVHVVLDLRDLFRYAEQLNELLLVDSVVLVIGAAASR